MTIIIITLFVFDKYDKIMTKTEQKKNIRGKQNVILFLENR